MGLFTYATVTICIGHAINKISLFRTGGETDKMRSVNKLLECN